MKLKDCLELAGECGLPTLGEALDNVWLHAGNLFLYDEMRQELDELKADLSKFGLDSIKDGNKLVADLLPLVEANP